MRNRSRYLAVPMTLALLATLASNSASVADHTTLPATVPTLATPNLNDGANNVVYALTRVGNQIIAGGIFQSATNQGDTTAIPVTNIVAWDATTGLVNTSFVPTLDGEVDSLLPGPTPDTVYVGGNFSNVDGVQHLKLVELNTTDGTVVTTFKPAALDATVNDMAMSGGRLFLGGKFTKVGKIAHGGLATLNPTTGATDPFMNVQLAGHHNYNGISGAKSAVGVEHFDISPDGTKLMVVGNFKTADGVSHDQGAMIDLTGTAAAVMPWFATQLTSTCNKNAFDDWVRDVSFSPDGSYFVIVGTGGPSAGTLCDSINRWETADASNPNAHATWIDRTGGDTVLAVTVTTAAVYVGGHFRWLNNSSGSDSARPGAVGRASIAALDPLSGLPLAWNPGRDPRGGGVRALLADSNGLYIGSDTNYIGYAQYYRGKVALLPLAGGYTPASTSTAQLPGTVYFPNVQTAVPTVLDRVNVGGPLVPATDGGPDWVADNTSSSPFHNAGGGTIVKNTKVITKTDGSLPAGTPLELFSDWRVDPPASPDMIWTFPVPSGAQVMVRLYFADRNSPPYVPGQRQFNITINGTQVATNYDIVGTAGYNTATMLSFPVTSTGTVTVQFTAVADKPLLDAVEIVNNGSATTGTGFGSRSYDGTTVGSLTPVGGADGTPWNNLRGAFLVGGNLFYGMSDGNFYRRTFDGTNFGPAFIVNPFSDPFWDGKATGSGTSTYTGVKSGFYSELTGFSAINAMFYQGGKLYYTRNGQSSLFWRWFTPDSGVTGSDEFTITGNSFNGTDGTLFISGGNLYWSKTDGKLYRIAFNGTSFSGSATAISGPSIDGMDWRSPGAFLGQ